MSVPSFLKPIGCLLAAFVLFAACDSPMPKETQPARSAGPIQAIINGQPSTAPEHAAVLQLLWYGEDICTATLIADLLVLTAAHCVYTNCDWSGESCELDDNPAHYSFRSVPSGQTRKVTAVHAHQNYDDEALTNDIALLELERAFDGVTPIPPLPGDAGRALTQADEGQSITYVGFGLTNPNNPYSSGTRMQTELEIWEVCPGPGTCFGSIPPRTFCSDMQTSGTCSGDSGGPAFLDRDGVTYVAGVTSFGTENCDYIGCSTNVSAFADWIFGYLGNGLTNGASCITDSQCDSGFCTQSVCCDTRCGDSPCEACSVAQGAARNGECEPIVRCEGETDCALAGVCDPSTGRCLYESKPSDTVCDDGNACSLGDHCLHGACVGAGAVSCIPNECQFLMEDTSSTCQPDTGACVYENRSDGTACGNGKKVCKAGMCVAPSSGSTGGCGAASAGAEAMSGLLLALSIAGLCVGRHRRHRHQSR